MGLIIHLCPSFSQFAWEKSAQLYELRGPKSSKTQHIFSWNNSSRKV